MKSKNPTEKAFANINVLHTFHHNLIFFKPEVEARDEFNSTCTVGR